MYAEAKKIKDLKKGEFFCLKDPADVEEMPENRVWVKGDYDRSSRKYTCSKWSDFCDDREFLGSKTVYAGFTF